MERTISLSSRGITGMDVEENLRRKKAAVDLALEEYLPSGDSVLEQAMRYAVLSGGKRFRPMLALASGEGFGLDWKEVLPFACSLEFIHNYSLIHDDLPAMDDDDLRRGKPSCHKAFGEAVALLAGDALLTLAFEVMARAPWDEERISLKMRVIAEIAGGAGWRGMIGGQILDISGDPVHMEEGPLVEMMAKKTGALIAAAVKTGPLLAGASEQAFRAMSAFGEKIGLAFQIRDDLLDDPGDSAAGPAGAPNAAVLFGREEAGKRLESLIRSGIQALDEARIQSDELRHLAHKLLERKVEP